MNKAINIFHFNPTCELAVANGSPYYQAPDILKSFEETIACLMLYFAQKDDIVIYNKPLSKTFKENLDLLQLNVNSLQTKEEALKRTSGNSLKHIPWGWSPAEEYFFKDFKSVTHHGADYYQKRYERKNSIELLTEIINEANYPLLLSKEELPAVVYSEKEIELLLLKWGKLVLKSPLSSSGRGLQIIRKKELDNSKRQWINTTFKQQGYLVCEPLLIKVGDLSFQFKVDSKKQIQFLGTSYFKTNNNGQYRGHLLNNKPKEVIEFEKIVPNNYIKTLAKEILHKLKKDVFLRYESYMGVDAMIYISNNKLKLQPCVEINPRFNMGMLSMKIQERIHPGSIGFFEIYNGNDYAEFAKSETKKNPPTFMDGKLKSGFVSLTDTEPNQRFGAFIRLGASE